MADFFIITAAVTIGNVLSTLSVAGYLYFARKRRLADADKILDEMQARWDRETETI